MNIIDRGISSSKSIDSGITAKIFERFKKSLLSSTAAIGVLAVCAVVQSGETRCPNNIANHTIHACRGRRWFGDRPE